MKLFRCRSLLLPAVIGLSSLTGACGGPLAVTAGSYGADGASLVETNKTASDHLMSMISKRDCAMWRIFRNQHVCRERDDDRDPYDVSYAEPFRQAGEGGVEYLPPLHAAADAPATSWDAKAYDRPGTNVSPSAPVTAAAGPTPVSASVIQTDTPAASPATISPPPPKAAVKHAAAKRKRLKKKHAPSRAATVP